MTVQMLQSWGAVVFFPEVFFLSPELQLDRGIHYIFGGEKEKATGCRIENMLSGMVIIRLFS